MLYEVAILEKPTKKEAEEGAIEKLVFGPKAVVAGDPQSAAITAVLDGEAPKVDKSRVMVGFSVAGVTVYPPIAI